MNENVTLKNFHFQLEVAQRDHQGHHVAISYETFHYISTVLPHLPMVWHQHHHLLRCSNIRGLFFM